MNNEKLDNNVYRKINGRYRAYGVLCEPEHLPDGVWYVRHFGHNRTNMKYLEGLYRMCDAKDVNINEINKLAEIAGMENLMDKVLKANIFHEMTSDNRGYSMADIVRATIKTLCDMTKDPT